MTAPQPGPHRAQLDAAVRSLGMQVNRDTVLRARAALLAEADRLDRELRRNTHEFEIGVGICGRDPVSPEAAEAFNDKIYGLIQHCGDYNRDLRHAARALDDIAMRYGYTEEQIAASFQGGP